MRTTKLMAPGDDHVRSYKMLDTLVRLGFIKMWEGPFTVDHSSGEVGLIVDGELIMIDY